MNNANNRCSDLVRKQATVVDRADISDHPAGFGNERAGDDSYTETHAQERIAIFSLRSH